MPPVPESQAFSERLRKALAAVGLRPSPTQVAREFNIRYFGRSITPHTARNWLLGQAMPTQDKLVVLADWLQVGPDELRFGRQTGRLKTAEADAGFEQLDMADREMLSRYLSLGKAERKTVRDVVTAMAEASAHRKSADTARRR